MLNLDDQQKKYFLAGAIGAVAGALTVTIVTNAIPKMMSKMMAGMMENMMTQMGPEGCNPAEMCQQMMAPANQAQ